MLLAGANQMPWARFMAANIAGSVAWSTLYGFGAYLLGHEAKQVAGPVAIGIGVVIAAAWSPRHFTRVVASTSLLAQPVRAREVTLSS